MRLLSLGLALALVAASCSADSSDDSSRVKRVSIDDDVDFGDSPSDRPKSNPRKTSKNREMSRAAVNGIKLNTPVLLPPYGIKGADVKFDKKTSSCLFYMETLTIVALKKSSVGSNQLAYEVRLTPDKDSFNWDPTYANCPKSPDSNYNGTFDFTIDYVAAVEAKHMKNMFSIAKDTNIKLKLTFKADSGYTLVGAKLLNDFKLVAGDGFFKSDVNVPAAEAKPATVLASEIRAPFGYALGCGATRGLFFDADNKEVLVGIRLCNFQLQASGVDLKQGATIPSFSHQVVDCVGTFSQGSWMGIIVTLVLVTVLMFGYLMLNSVQTMDRFDDPKQKQIQINFKE